MKAPQRLVDYIEQQRASMPPDRRVTVLNASLYFAGIERPRMKPEVDLCPFALAGTYRACIFHPDCFKPLEKRRIVVENDPREMDGTPHAGLILPAGIV